MVFNSPTKTQGPAAAAAGQALKQRQPEIYVRPPPQEGLEHELSMEDNGLHLKSEGLEVGGKNLATFKRPSSINFGFCPCSASSIQIRQKGIRLTHLRRADNKEEMFHILIPYSDINSMSVCNKNTVPYAILFKPSATSIRTVRTAVGIHPVEYEANRTAAACTVLIILQKSDPDGVHKLRDAFRMDRGKMVIDVSLATVDKMLNDVTLGMRKLNVQPRPIEVDMSMEDDDEEATDEAGATNTSSSGQAGDTSSAEPSNPMGNSYSVSKTRNAKLPVAGKPINLGPFGQINTKDVFTLNDKEFLNDAIIDLYLSYITKRLISPEMRERIHIFSSFFYSRIESLGKKLPANKKQSSTLMKDDVLKRWTRNVDLFGKDFLIIPMNKDYHWTVCIICYPNNVVPLQDTSDSVSSTTPVKTEAKVEPKEEAVSSSQTETVEENTDYNSKETTAAQSPFKDEGIESNDSNQSGPSKEADSSDTPKKEVKDDPDLHLKRPMIIILDSLGPLPNTKGQLSKSIRQWLSMEGDWRNNKRDFTNRVVFPDWTPRVPEQTNHCDCGLYVFRYVQTFLEDPATTIGNYPTKDLRKSFSFDVKELEKTMRSTVRKTIAELEREANGESSGLNVMDTLLKVEPRKVAKIEPINFDKPSTVPESSQQNGSSPKEEQDNGNSETPTEQKEDISDDSQSPNKKFKKCDDDDDSEEMDTTLKDDPVTSEPTHPPDENSQEEEKEEEMETSSKENTVVTSEPTQQQEEDKLLTPIAGGDDGLVHSEPHRPPVSGVDLLFDD